MSVSGSNLGRFSRQEMAQRYRFEDMRPYDVNTSLKKVASDKMLPTMLSVAKKRSDSSRPYSNHHANFLMFNRNSTLSE